MVLYADTITLLDRTQLYRTPKTGTDGVPNGDLKPWRVRLELVNTGEDGVDNSGVLTLRVDDKKTFIKTGPLFMEESAKKKYLIEAYITQTIGGTSVKGKVFMFQIGTPQITVDRQSGGMITIQLQEIQRRTQETLSSRELRFLTPAQALDARLLDFNRFQGLDDESSGNKQVRIFTKANRLPENPELEYVPQSPVTIKSHFDKMFKDLTESQATGGSMTDFYYDYDPDTTVGSGFGGLGGKPLVTYITADAIGRVDSGCVIDPLSAEAVDSEEQQDTNTDFFKFRNHVIARGAPTSGSLPVEHAKFASNWLHSKVRPLWASDNEVEDRKGNEFAYLRGDTVIRKFTCPYYMSNEEFLIYNRTIPTVKLIRCFQAQNDILRSTNTGNDGEPENNQTDWKEDLLLYPEWDKTGHYTAGDIIYYNVGAGSNIVYRFYRCHEDIYDWSLNRYRYSKDTNGGNGSFPKASQGASLTSTKHLAGVLREDNSNVHGNTYTGFLTPPDSGLNAGWLPLDNQGVGGDNVPDHVVSTEDYGTSFEGFKGFSPWTADVFDWEANMAATPKNNITSSYMPFGASAGHKTFDSAATATTNRYVGLVPDWNITKDVYDKQDIFNDFENISMKVVTRIDNDPPTDDKEIYHGQRIMVGTSGNGLFDGHDNQLAQYFYNSESPVSGSKWMFSRSPIDGDTFQNLEDGRVYQWNADLSTPAWDTHWKIKRTVVADKKNVQYGSAAMPFHIVKDVYKTRGFEGTPNSAIEFRFAWDQGSGSKHRSEADTNGLRNNTMALYGSINTNKESIACRLNSRGVWIAFWFPFPRTAHSENGTVNIGDQYGGNGDSPIPKSGFTTLNTYNNTTDRTQSAVGWNNGEDSEDMGKISGLSFRIKIGIYAQNVDWSNDDYFTELSNHYLVVGEANIPMTFWCVDMFDRIWTSKFTVRKNGYWDEKTIQFGDMSSKNLHIPRFDELLHFGIRPLGFSNFALPQREYTGVAFDWRFVKGWGIQMDSSYDKENGYYHGGFDYWIDTASQFGEQIKQTLWNAGAAYHNHTGNGGKNSTYINARFPVAYAIHNQATIALDDLHFDKELVVNSDDDTVKNARTETMIAGNVSDYITLKSLAKSARARLSFYPQYWHMRAIGDVRLRVGKSFKVKGDRMPNMTDMDSVTAYAAGTTYNEGDKVSYTDGYVYQSLKDGQSGNTPNAASSEDVYWENVNKLACSEVRHLIDSEGFHMTVQGCRKFILTGEA